MRRNAERSAVPQGVNLESKLGETVRHDVGGTGDTRARDAQKRCAPRRDDVGRRFTRAWGGGVDRDGKWGCLAQAMRWLPYHRTPWNPVGKREATTEVSVREKN